MRVDLMKKIGFLSGNMLKIIAAASMFVDHMGIMFFPGVEIFRIIGRLAFPIFAFMISEGARYTKSKFKYFILLFGLAVVCQTAYWFVQGDMYLNILFTFSISVLLIYALQSVKKMWFSTRLPFYARFAAGALCMSCAIVAVWYINTLVKIDYGFWGCVTPLFASLFDFKDIKSPKMLEPFDSIAVRVLVMAIPILVMGWSYWLMRYALLALLLLLCYSGERGKLKMKYFFYIFYPLHFVILEGIYMLIK